MRAAELRLHDPRDRDRWRLRGANAPLRVRAEIPFSLEALNAMRFGVVQNAGGAAVEPADLPTALEVREPANQGRSRKWRESTIDDDDNRCDRAFRCGQWFVLLLVVCSVAVVVTLLSMVFVRVGDMVDSMAGSSMQAKVDRVLDHAMEAALHTETATANAAQMSILAKHAVEEAHPRLIAALNQSSEMMADLRDFSLHPHVTVSTGAVFGGGRRRA
jgi:hypothetical protein